MVCSREGERSVSKDGSGSENEIDYESDEEILVDNVKGKKDKRLRLSMADEVDNGLCLFKRLRKRSHKSCRLSRCNCPASITFRKDRTCTFFYVSQFITKHNHPLTRRKHKHFVRSNRAVKDHDIAQVMSLRNVSVGTARAYEYLVHQARGHEFVGFTERDLYNRVQREHSKLIMDGDAQASITWMKLKAIRDPNFFCIFSVDDTGRLANMFWRDGQSYDDYCTFGDVLIFDSTYKTNIYDKSLAVFVGTNNHRATVIFGCALLADEIEETYDWVLTAFLKSMNGQKPSSVITDSDEAMRNAVVNVIPEVKYRLCAWHVGRNVKSYLKDVDMKRDFFHLIFAGFTPAEWEVSWQYFVAMNNLEDNSWINGMYEKKDRWAEAFFREVFFGGIYSTQRCEGMHKNMKIGLGSCMRLYELLPRFEKTACHIRNGALYDDYRSDKFSAECKSHIRDMEEDSCIFSVDDPLLAGIHHE
ncbi:protein FAR-RED IMPAIRED RESPONSE 1-like [Argentina anserina]|uniref:protein FAR-RED IMPAIRED RESPONSE 1-like n=1 Tax=Argentina anserina TaxID=57926 RepID=UPI002176750A|nr:protein FAR-RED IMPAIRED RESPONSE 1-like [Potentilla anserina]